MLSAIQKSKSNIKMTKLISFVLAFVLIFSYAVAQIDDWCIDSEDYFVQNCPIQRGDYNGCCLCTQYYYYSCGKYFNSANFFSKMQPAQISKFQIAAKMSLVKLV